MGISFPIEPEEVLGLTANASLDELRVAYRERAKRHHPDAGGESWAFRIITQCYEWMVMQRMTHKLREEESREETRSRRPPEPPPRAQASAAPASDPDDTHARKSTRDTVSDTVRLVDVEVFTIRYELNDPTQLLYARAEERTLTCSLNVTWPSREFEGKASASVPELLPIVQGAFRSLVKKTRAKISHIHDMPDQFNAWVSYPTATKANEAFEQLRAMLNEHGMGVAQWLRDVILPKPGR